MPNESEQAVASAFHMMRQQAKAEKRGRDKRAMGIVDAVLRNVRGETPKPASKDTPWEEE